MIIGIIGSRDRNTISDRRIIEEAFFLVYNEGDWICSGGCSKGADKFAKQISIKYCIPYLEFPANWDKFGKKAGFIRNNDIAKISEYLLAMPNNNPKSGTADTIKKWKTFHPNGKCIMLL